MIDRFRLVPAAYVVLRRGDSVLLQLRQNTGFMDGYWACAAAGHVEAGESVFDAAVREAWEEVGLRLDPTLLSPVTTLHRTDGSDQEIEQRIDWFFLCDEWDGVPTIQEPAKCADLRWFPFSELPALVPPHERLVLESIAAGAPAAIMALGFEPSRSTLLNSQGCRSTAADKESWHIG